jgi:hypothetical protein
MLPRFVALVGSARPKSIQPISVRDYLRCARRRCGGRRIGSPPLSLSVRRSAWIVAEPFQAPRRLPSGLCLKWLIGTGLGMFGLSDVLCAGHAAGYAAGVISVGSW